MKQLSLALLLAATVTSAHAAQLTGVVTGDNAKPLGGAHVYVYTAQPKVGISSLCPSCYRDCGKHKKVDANGAFRIDDLDPTLRFQLLAVADGYEPRYVNGVDPATGAVTIRLTPRSLADADRLITGAVVDQKGKPVVGAAVEPSGYHLGKRTGWGRIPGLDQLSVTNEKGEFALRMPDAAGTLDVRVKARGLAPIIERDLAPNAPRVVHMFEGATISGHVEREGKPVGGARVVIVQSDRRSSNFVGLEEIGTNDDGLFVMTNLRPNDNYYVYVPMEGNGGIARKLVALGADQTRADAGTLSLTAGRRIEGKLVLPEGMSTPPKTRILLYIDTDAQNIEVKDDGTFLFEHVPDGKTHLVVRVPPLRLAGAASAREESELSLPETGDVKDLVVKLER